MYNLIRQFSLPILNTLEPSPWLLEPYLWVVAVTKQAFTLPYTTTKVEHGLLVLSDKRAYRHISVNVNVVKVFSAIPDSSVAHFHRVAVFETLQHRISVKDGAHMHS